MDVHVYDISRASISISFGGVLGGGGAEPSLPETKNELHLGAEHTSLLWFKSCGEEEQHVFIFYIFNRIKSIKNIKMNVSELKVHT